MYITEKRGHAMDKEMFTQAVERHQDMVYRVALHALGSPQDADDAVQEVFLRLLRWKKGFEGPEHLRRWLLRVTVNVCRDMLRSPWRRRRVDLERAGPIPVFDRSEDGALYAAVMALPEQYRTVLDLFYYEELSTAEIGGLLHLSRTAVTTRLSRAREALKEKLGEEWRDA